MAVEAMQKGAVSFLQKPFRDQELLDCIKAAMAKDSAQRAASSSRSEIGARVERLTTREREVMELVVAGKSNKVIGFELGVSQRTVEIHRAPGDGKDGGTLSRRTGQATSTLLRELVSMTSISRVRRGCKRLRAFRSPLGITPYGLDRYRYLL